MRAPAKPVAAMFGFRYRAFFMLARRRTKAVVLGVPGHVEMCFVDADRGRQERDHL